MAHIFAEYRFELRAPRSVDSTEATVLTPISGAIHSDPFQVTTEHGGATGWRPYLSIPRGRHGRLDPLLHKTSTGEYQIDVQDAIAGTRAERWVTAYIGDERGRNRFKGLRAIARQRLTIDGVVGSWEDLFVGRVDRVEKPDGRAFYRFYVSSDRKDESRNIFTGAPHDAVTYAYPCYLLPIGLQDRGDGFAWDGNAKTPRARGSVDVYTRNGVQYSRVTVDFDHGAPSNLLRITNALASSLDRWEELTPGSGTMITPHVRCRLKRLDTNAEGDFWVAPVLHPTLRSGYDGAQYSPLFHDDSGRVQSFGILPVTAVDADGNASTHDHPFKYMAVPPDGTSCEFYLYRAGPPTEDAPILIDQVDPMVLWRDLLDGHFSDLDEFGEPLYRPIAYNDAAFVALEGMFPKVRGIVQSSANLNDWLEQFVLRAIHASARVNGSGEVEPADIRIPEDPNAISQTITAADYFNDPQDHPVWRYGRDIISTVAVSNQTVRFYSDTIAKATRTGDVPLDIPPHGMVVDRLPSFAFASEMFADVPPRIENVEGIFLASPYPGVPIYDVVMARQASREYLSWFGSGGTYLELPCRRTSNTDVWPGDYVLVEVTSQPNTAANELGGTRVMLVLDRYDRDDGSRFLELLDAGPDTVAVAPTLGAPAQDATTPKHVIAQGVTLNASSNGAELWYAVTDTSTTVRPAASSTLWVLHSQVSQSSTVTIGNLPSGKRVWTRARTRRLGALASEWAYPGTGSGYVDTQVIDPPTALVTIVTGRSIAASCTPGDTSYPLMPIIAESPATPTNAMVTPLLAGSTRFVFDGLEAGTYTVGFKSVDQFGGESASVTADVATGDPVQLASPRRVYLRQFSSQPIRDRSRALFEPIVTGLEVRWRSNETHAQVKIQVATDEAFAAIESEVIVDAEIGKHRIVVVLDGFRRYVRLIATRPGYADSDPSSIVSGFPTILSSVDGPDSHPGGWAHVTVDSDGTPRIHIGTDDPDTQRAYWAATVVDDESAYPEVDDTDTEVLVAAMPYHAQLTSGGSVVRLSPGQRVLLTVRFSGDVGFGQTVYDEEALPMEAILQRFGVRSRTSTAVVAGGVPTARVSVVLVFDKLIAEPDEGDTVTPVLSDSDVPATIIDASDVDVDGFITYESEYPPRGFHRYLWFIPLDTEGVEGRIEILRIDPNLQPAATGVEIDLALQASGGQLTVAIGSIGPTATWWRAWARLGAWPTRDGTATQASIPDSLYLKVDDPPTTSSESIAATDGTWYVIAQAYDQVAPGPLDFDSIVVTGGGDGTAQLADVRVSVSTDQHRIRWDHNAGAGTGHRVVIGVTAFSSLGEFTDTLVPFSDARSPALDGAADTVANEGYYDATVAQGTKGDVGVEYVLHRYTVELWTDDGLRVRAHSVDIYDYIEVFV